MAKYTSNYSGTEIDDLLSRAGLLSSAGKASSAALADSATILQTPRSIITNLASTSSASFNGSGDVSPGVSGILPVANGGTGCSTIISLQQSLGIVDYTSQCSFVNSWRVYSNSFRCIKIGLIVYFTGLLYAGTIGTNVNICQLPSDIATNAGRYQYIVARPLGNGDICWLPVRGGYLCQDNNAAANASTDNLVAIQGAITLS